MSQNYELRCDLPNVKANDRIVPEEDAIGRDWDAGLCSERQTGIWSA